MQTAAEQTIVNGDGTFTLNGVTFKIDSENKRLEVDPTTLFDEQKTDLVEKFKEFRQEIVDGKFNIEGVWYVIDGSNLKYVGVEDSLLTKVRIATDGTGTYNNLTFQFANSGNVNLQSSPIKLNVIKAMSIQVIDRVIDERCAFDNQSVPVTANKTFDWWISN